MKINYAGLKLIMDFEGCRLRAYKAVPTEKHYTIGYGHYGADVSPNMVITQKQAEDLLRKDIERFEKAVMKYEHIYHFNENEFSALVSFAYNVGSIAQLTASGTRTRSQIASAIPKYVRSGNKVLQGLIRRRQAELSLFLKEV